MLKTIRPCWGKQDGRAGVKDFTVAPLMVADIIELEFSSWSILFDAF